MFRKHQILTRLGLSFGLVVLLGLIIPIQSAIADEMFLGTQTSTPEFEFIGTGTSLIDILLEDCSGGVCTMASGSGNGTGALFSENGTYTFSTTSSSPFTLTCLGGGDFSVSQTVPIDFSFTSATGTLTGTVNFTFSTDVGGGTLAGVLTVTGGTFASDFPSGFADMQLSLGNGFPLSDLCGATGTIDSEIDGGTIVAAPVSTGSCPLTQGFWKNHPSAWPVSSLTIGGVTLTEAQLIKILKTAPKHGNATLILVHQLIAALLNVENGSIPDPLVQATITDAQNLLAGEIGSEGKITFVAAGSTLGQKMVSDAELLDAFNNGAFSTGCTND